MDELKVVNLYENAPKNRVDNFVNNTRSELNVSTNLNKVETDFSWLDIMENTIRYFPIELL